MIRTCENCHEELIPDGFEGFVHVIYMAEDSDEVDKTRTGRYACYPKEKNPKSPKYSMMATPKRR